MHTHNPYSQAGWGSSQNSDSNRGDFPSIPPSIFGALPSPNPTSNSEFLTFYFASFNPTILNSVVVGPSRSYIDIITSSSSLETTSLRNCEGRTLAKIEWYEHPVVNVPGAVPRQLSSRFLEISPDGSFRLIRFREKNYAWIESSSSSSICLYNISYNPAELLARIIQARDSVNLQITTAAIHAGLMEICLVSTVLLLSRRNIE
ncbi:hypothetical protein BDQ17DRAFT_1428574 [Cyathus striatus]|nr:hypothetical protein BDQ17DRAFT_1428574 [Cyathus striatus]